MFGIFKRLKDLEGKFNKLKEDHASLRKEYDGLSRFYWTDGNSDLQTLLQFEKSGKDNGYIPSIKILGHKITRKYNLEVKAEKLKKHQ